SMHNTGNAFSQSHDAFGNYGDHHTTIIGGKYCCNRSPAPAAILQINSDAFKLSNANVDAGEGEASAGVAFGRGHIGCEIDAIHFANLPAGREIVADAGACRSADAPESPQELNPVPP